MNLSMDNGLQHHIFVCVYIHCLNEYQGWTFEWLCFSLKYNGFVPGGYFYIRRLGEGGLASKSASEILVGAPNFASKNISDKIPQILPLNFRYDPKIGTFPQLLCLVATELPKFVLLFGELGQTLPQILPPNLM